MKKKYIGIGLALAFVLGLVACGGQQAQEPDQQEPSQEVQQMEPISTEPISTEPTTPPVETGPQDEPKASEVPEVTEPVEVEPVEDEPGDGEGESVEPTTSTAPVPVETPKQETPKPAETKPVQTAPANGGETSDNGRPADFDDQMKEFMEQNGYTGGADHAMTQEEGEDLRGAIRVDDGGMQADGAGGSVDPAAQQKETDPNLQAILDIIKGEGN